jgi:hypothetical protein
MSRFTFSLQRIPICRLEIFEHLFKQKVGTYPVVWTGPGLLAAHFTPIFVGLVYALGRSIAPATEGYPYITVRVPDPNSFHTRSGTRSPFSKKKNLHFFLIKNAPVCTEKNSSFFLNQNCFDHFFVDIGTFWPSKENIQLYKTSPIYCGTYAGFLGPRFKSSVRIRIQWLNEPDKIRMRIRSNDYKFGLQR